ncbi:MAG: magnesium transporter [Rhodospirillales bacterium]|nr:magnesium transporter [Rhodospirillales bacterium]
MPDKFDLALEIAATHPKSVARYLEESPSDSASAFIDAVPDDLSSSILRSMLPYHAAKCIDQLATDAAGRYLSALEPRFAASIVRHVGTDRRDALVGAMTRPAAARVAILLRYPLSVVGAWINPTLPTLPLDCRIAEAKARILREGYADHHRIFVVDDDQGLAGFVRLFDLLDVELDRPLIDFLQSAPGSLRAGTSLDIALDDQNWLNNDFLPVVDRHERLIGVLRYAVLRAAVSGPKTRIMEDGVSDTFMDLAEACYLGLADVMKTSLATEPPRTGSEGG